MKINNYIWAFVFLSGGLLVGSCQKDDIDMYHGKQALNLYINTDQEKKVDEMNIPFVFMKGITEYTIPVNVEVMGYPASYDREIELIVADSSSAKSGENFDMQLTAKIPANEMNVIIPCVVKREGLEEKGNEGIKLSVVLKQTKDFSVGINKVINISASDVTPSVWYNGTFWVDMYLGTCSPTKYRFLFEKAKIWDFAPIANNYGLLMQLQAFLRQKLAEYEHEEGKKLYDPDLKKDVTFP